MSKKQKTYEESMQIFIEELKKNGVSDKTIKQVVKEINVHTQQIIEKQIKDVFTNIREVVKKQRGED